MSDQYGGGNGISFDENGQPTLSPGARAMVLQALQRGMMNNAPTQNVGKAVGAVAPNMGSYVQGNTDPYPPMTPTPQGKLLPSSGGPRATAAAQDVGLSAAVAPLATLGGAGAAAGRVASEFAPEMAGPVARVAAGLPAYDLAATGKGVGEMTAGEFAQGALRGGSSEAQAAPKAPPPPTGKAAQPGAEPQDMPGNFYTDEEKAQIRQINTKILQQQQAMAKATEGYGAKGTQARSGTFEAEIARLQGQLSTIDANANQRAAEQAPFAIRHPGVNLALDFAPALSPVTGGAVGLGAGRVVTPYKRAMAYGGAVGGGALEGTIGAGYAEKQDLRMPEGSEGRKAAIRNANDPYWQLGSLGEVATSAGLGALGAKLGMLRKWAPAQEMLQRPTAPQPSAGEPALAPSSATAPAAIQPPPQAPQLPPPPASGVRMKYGQEVRLTRFEDANGKPYWRDQFGHSAKPPANPQGQ